MSLLENGKYNSQDLKINKINFIIYKKYYNINNYLRLGGKYSSLSILKISSSD